ncbi:MAG: hypothetical protein V1859_03500 [archaeon]
MTKKEKCKEIMASFFGPATANLVEMMSEEECVAKCKENVLDFLGPEKAKVFDNI